MKDLKTEGRIPKIVVPINALPNSQLGELDKYFKEVSPEHQVTYARYTSKCSGEVP
jgi:hypothetical protein